MSKTSIIWITLQLGQKKLGEPPPNDHFRVRLILKHVTFIQEITPNHMYVPKQILMTTPINPTTATS